MSLRQGTEPGRGGGGGCKKGDRAGGWGKTETEPGRGGGCKTGGGGL